jgi:hypothetical protein
MSCRQFPESVINSNSIGTVMLSSGDGAPIQSNGPASQAQHVMHIIILLLTRGVRWAWRLTFRLMRGRDGYRGFLSSGPNSGIGSCLLDLLQIMLSVCWIDDRHSAQLGLTHSRGKTILVLYMRPSNVELCIHPSRRDPLVRSSSSSPQRLLLSRAKG